MESGLRDQFASRGVAVHDVSCDHGTPAKVGARVSCTALNAAGTKLVITGRVTSIHGDRARFHFDAARGVATGTTVAAQVRALLERRVGQRAKAMTCPARVDIPTTRPVTCRLETLDGKVFDTEVRIDGHGNVSAAVAKAPNP